MISEMHNRGTHYAWNPGAGYEPAIRTQTCVRLGLCCERRRKRLTAFKTVGLLSPREYLSTDWNQSPSCIQPNHPGVVRLKNRLSAYSLVILLGLSLATTAIVLHNPFATHPPAAPQMGGGGSSQPSVLGSSSSTFSATSTSPGPGHLNSPPPPLHHSSSDGGDDGHDGSYSNYNGTRIDD